MTVAKLSMNAIRNIKPFKNLAAPADAAAGLSQPILATSINTHSDDQEDLNSLRLLVAQQQQQITQQQQLLQQRNHQQQADRQQQDLLRQQRAAEILLLKREIREVRDGVGKHRSHQDQAAGLQISCNDDADDNNSSLHHR